MENSKGGWPNHPPSPLVEFLWAKNDLHVMEQILYDTGWRTVAKWPRKRTQKLEVSNYGEMIPDLPKIGKKKFVLKCILGHFQCFVPMFF